MKSTLLALALLATAGCNYKQHYVPDSGIEMARADYSVMNATSAEACGVYILGIDWGHLFADSTAATRGEASILSLIAGGSVPEERRALYDALEKMPEATHLLPNKAHITTTGFSPFGVPIFGKRCAAIEAHGVKIGKGPVPNAM